MQKNTVDTSKITQEMRTEFWKHNLNPITGLPHVSASYTQRGLNSVHIADQRIKRFKSNRY